MASNKREAEAAPADIDDTAAKKSRSTAEDSAEATSSETKTYTGGCHCKNFRYELTEVLPTETTTKCNCSFCCKTNHISINLKPDENDEFSQFKLVSPASWEELGNYSFGPGRPAGKFFCKNCGIHVVTKAKYEIHGHKINHMGVNAATLDPGQVDLRKWKMQYWDGLHDNHAAGLKDEPWEGGAW